MKFRHSKPERYAILGDYVVTSLGEKINILTEDDWKQIEERKTLFGQEDCDSIVIHNDVDRQSKVFNKAMTNHRLLFLLDKELHSICRIIDQTYPNGVPRRILLNKLPAGKSIKPHTDLNHHLTTCRRIHIPIITDPNVDFIVDGVKIPMNEGKIVEINNNVLHKVDNFSSCDRIHLLIDWGRNDDPYYLQGKAL